MTIRLEKNGKIIVRRRRGRHIYHYQQTARFFAQVAETLKADCADELADLGAEKLKMVPGGIEFKANRAALYRINYAARLASRILAPITSFPCADADGLYQAALKIRWWDFLGLHNTFAIFSNVTDSKIRNSHFASLRLKDAIVDSFRLKFGKRPSIRTKAPDIWINLYLKKDHALISLDTSGGSLHRRGYRSKAVSAPMQETVAAAILRSISWDRVVPLFDPMCGSGTLICEALMLASNIPAGYLRKHYGFEYLPDYDPKLWETIKAELDRQINMIPPGLISGSDISSKAVAISRGNLGRLPHGNRVSVKTADWNQLGKQTPCLVVANPPYGIRMGKNRDLGSFYRAFGDFLKQKCAGSTAYLFFGERTYIKHLGLKPSWKKPIQTGGLDGRLVKYALY
jgi:putative N6-adenine-specific DNA methylase